MQKKVLVADAEAAVADAEDAVADAAAADCFQTNGRPST